MAGNTTSSDKADQIVDQILETGNVPSVEDEYERTTVVRRLRDYAGHPHTSETLTNRAENAISQLEN